MDIDADEAHARVLKLGLRRGGEIAETRAEVDHEIRCEGERVGGGGAGHADGTEARGVRVEDRAFAGLRDGDGNAGGLGEFGERDRGVTVVDAAAGDDERTARGAEQCDGGAEFFVGARWALHVVDAFFEKMQRVESGLGLHVFGHGDRHGTGVGGIGEDAHRLGQGGEELFGTVNPVPVF